MGVSVDFDPNKDNINVIQAKRKLIDVETIKRICLKIELAAAALNINIIDLFNFFDQDHDFMFESYKLLERIFFLLQIEVEPHLIQRLFYFFADQRSEITNSKYSVGERMLYMRFVKQLVSAEDVLKSSIIKILIAKEMTLAQLFMSIRPENKKALVWEYEDLEHLNS